jgi:hypothetical protein
MKRVPAKFQSALWSYNISKIDADKSFHLVITHLLNYGGEDEKEWVLSNYPEGKIKEVIESPSRGTWSRERLLYWKKRLKAKIPKLDFEIAIFTLDPYKNLELIKKYYLREEKRNKEYHERLVKAGLNSF